MKVILDELNRETNQSETESDHNKSGDKAPGDSEDRGEKREDTELTVIIEDKEDTVKESTEIVEEKNKPKTKKSKKKTSSKIGSSQTIENKDTSLLTGNLFDFK